MARTGAKKGQVKKSRARKSRAKKPAAGKSQANQAWKLYRELVERAWADPAFRERLRQDTKGTLQKEIAAAGVEISLPERVRLIEDTAKLANFTVPVEGGQIC